MALGMRPGLALSSASDRDCGTAQQTALPNQVDGSRVPGAQTNRMLLAVSSSSESLLHSSRPCTSCVVRSPGLRTPERTADWQIRGPWT